MNKEGHEMVADLNLRIQDLSEANQRLEQEVKTLRSVKEEAEQYELMGLRNDIRVLSNFQ
jgi:FtsZ-binding cell division protein ZapB